MLPMFEELRERAELLGEGLSEWLRMDEVRGKRMEGMLRGIHGSITTQGEQMRSGRVNSIVANSQPSDGVAVTKLLVKPPFGTHWNIEGIFPTVANAAAQRNIALYMAQQDNAIDRPLMAVAVGTAVASEGLPVAANGLASLADFPLPESMGILARGIGLALGEVLSLHLVVREFTPHSIKVAGTTDEEGIDHPAQFPGSESELNFSREVVPAAATAPEPISDEEVLTGG